MPFRALGEIHRAEIQTARRAFGRDVLATATASNAKPKSGDHDE